MRIHRHIYVQLCRLIPGLEGLEARKEPYLLELKGHLPVNVHVERKGRGRCLLLLLGAYPSSEKGVVFPSPEVKVHIDLVAGAAVPLCYVDRTRQLVKKGNAGGANGVLDCTVDRWLTKLERSGFKLGGDNKKEFVVRPPGP